MATSAALNWALNNGMTQAQFDKRIFDADKTMIKYNRTIDWRKIKKTVEMDDVDDARKNF